MELHRNDNQTEHVLTASGTIGVAELPELRTRLLEAIERRTAFDLLLDARQRIGVRRRSAAGPDGCAEQSETSSAPRRRPGPRRRCPQCEPAPQRPAFPIPGLP